MWLYLKSSLMSDICQHTHVSIYFTWFLFVSFTAFMALCIAAMALKTCPNQFQIGWHMKMCGSWYLDLMIPWADCDNMPNVTHINTTCKCSHCWHCPHHCSTNVHFISITNYFPPCTDWTDPKIRKMHIWNEFGGLLDIWLCHSIWWDAVRKKHISRAPATQMADDDW